LYHLIEIHFKIYISVTLELLRKRAEHNEGEISTLEEVTLHQQSIGRIELLDRCCPKLKILYLQANEIEKIGTLTMS